MTRICVTWILGIVLVFAPDIAARQQQQELPQQATAAISGKVFATTDLEPAKSAAVYLIYHHSEADSQNLVREQLTTAGTVFDKFLCGVPLIVSKGKKTKRVITYCDPSRPSTLSKPAYGAFMGALMMALYWARGNPAPGSPLCCIKEGTAPFQGNNAPEQVQEVTADDEGVFKIVAKVAGHYLLVVKGHAGMNALSRQDEAVWLEALDIKLGKEYKLKMSTPVSVYRH